MGPLFRELKRRNVYRVAATYAVVAFQALGDTDSTAIAEGLHSDLLTRLQRISSLTVIGRASVIRYEDTEISVALFRRAIERDSSFALAWAGLAEAHNWLGFVQLVLGRSEEALTHLELARDLNPEHVLARHYLYDLYIMKGQIERGLEEIRKQKRRYGLTPAAEVRALYHLGRYEEARTLLQGELRRSADREGSASGWAIAYLAGVETALGDTASDPTTDG